MYKLFYLIAMLGQPSVPQEQITKIYPIQDLVHVLPNFREVPKIDLQSALSQGNPFTADNSSDQFGFKDPAGIMMLIQTLVEPDSWLTGESTMIYYNGNLIIKASPEIHKQIN